MCKTNVTLLAVLLMLSACSTVETFFEPSEDAVPEKAVVAAQPAPEPVAFSPSQVETLNDNLRLIRENRAIKARLAAAEGRNAELETKLAELSRQQAKPAAPVVQPVSQSELLASSADVDVYQRNVGRMTQQQIAAALSKKGFSPKYPSLPNTMSMASRTMVFYYDNSYISTAGVLAQELAAVPGKPVAVKKGASSFAKNKIVVQIVGSGM